MNDSAASPPLATHSTAGPGTRLNDVYVIDRLIATGGMGQVFVGRAIETADKVAIKMIRPELARSDTYLALFRKEAAALHRAPHDAIVRYYLFTTDPELGCPYLAMEFVEGESLATLLARGPLPLETARILLKRVADGLDVAHRAGVIHRDVSPDNVILPDDDPRRAKIIDFGIARDAKGDATVIGGEFAGKLNFVSPEQIGLFGGEVGAPSDVYSLGLTLAAALLGRPLDMEGLPAEVVRKRSVLPDLSGAPAEMRQLLTRMLQPDPKDRPTMAEVAAAADAPAPGADAAPRRRAAAIAAGIFAFALLGAGLFAARLLPGREGDAAPARPALAARQDGRREEAPAAAQGRLPAQAQAETQAPTEAPAPAGAEAGKGPAETVAESRADQRADHAAEAYSELKLSEIPATPSPVSPVEAAKPAPSAAAPKPAPAEPAADESGAAFNDCAQCPQMISLPGGVFTMGGDADASERPAHKVRIKAFAIGRFPVTGAEWRACVAAKGCGYDPGGADDAPAHNLSWDDARQYVAWLSGLTGRRYRLPSEAEWEYAARGGTTTRFWWGDQFRPGMAACRGCGEAVAEAPPRVGQYPANGFGLKDVTGSAKQWVEDCWRRSYRGAPTDGAAATGPNCAARVLRGGSWASAPADLRPTNREFYEPKVRYPGNGLRVARDP